MGSNPERAALRRFAKRPEVVSRRIAGEAILVPVRSQVAELDSIFTLNDMGSLVWDLLDGEKTVSQIADLICASYEVATEEARQDLLEFLAELESAGLIGCAPEGA
jgi:hypothetical protein